MPVTPYVGVWIETIIRYFLRRHLQVTPYVGVWIETLIWSSMKTQSWSLLMWECGLKQLRRCACLSRVRSLLMWECGLKLPFHPCGMPTRLSLLMWECGLKRCLRCMLPLGLTVTPYVGVWIETFNVGSCCAFASVTPYVGVWIETGTYKYTPIC